MIWRPRKPPHARHLPSTHYRCRRAISTSPPPANCWASAAARESLPAAEAELRAALEMNVALAGPDSWRTARSEAGLAWMLIKRRTTRGGRTDAGGGALQIAGDGGTAASCDTAGDRAARSSTIVRITVTPRRNGFSRRLTSGKLAELCSPRGVRLSGWVIRTTNEES